MKNDFFASGDNSEANNTQTSANNGDNGGVIVNLGSTTNAVDSSTSNVDTQNTYYGTSINATPVQNENVSMDVQTNTVNNFNEGNVLSNVNTNQGAGSTLNNSEKPKKSKKIFIIIGIIVGVIIIAIIAAFVYVKFMFTAPNFIDEKVEEFSTFIDEVFASSNYSSLNEVVSSGTLNITSNMEELAAFNDANLNFEMGYSTTKEVMDLSIDLLKSDNSILNAQMYIDSNNMYLNSVDLYSEVLYMPLEENPFASLNSDDALDIETLQSTLKNFVNYLGIALEEAEVTSEINGLTATYTYQIDDSNKEAFANRLSELVESDTDMLDMLGITDASIDAEELDDMFLEIIVKIPSGDIEGFTFVTTDLEVVLESIQDNTYELHVNEEVIDVVVNGDDVTIDYENEEGNINITYNLVEFTLSGNMSADGYEYIFDITNTDDNGKNILFDFTSEEDDTSLGLDLTTNEVSDTESTLEGTLEISSNGMNLALEISLNNKYGSNLVEEQSFNGAVDMNLLTTAEQNEISNNLANVLTELGLANVLDTGSDTFALTSYNVNEAARTYFLFNEEATCVTVSDLINMGYLELDANSYYGKITRYDDSYILSLTDGNLMVVDVLESDIESSIREFDAIVFSSYYYTCY